MPGTLAENPHKDETLKLSAAVEKKLMEQIRKDWETADGSRMRQMRDKEEGLNLYYGVRKAKDFPFKNCANLHVPLIRTIADTLHSNIMGSLDTAKPSTITPVGPEDVPKSRKIEKTLNWQFSTQVDYNDLCDKIAQGVLIYGKCPVKTRYVIERGPDGSKIFDGLKCDVLPMERFLTPPDAPNTEVQDMDYVIQEIPMTRSDIKKRMADKKAAWKKMTVDELDKVGTLAGRADRESMDNLANIRDLITGVETGSQGRQPVRSFGTVLEWYGYFDTDDDGIDEPVMAIMLKENGHIFRVSHWTRLRPFTLVTFAEVLHKGEAESVPDLLKWLNMELNTLHNQRVDAVTLQNIPFFFFDPIAGFNPNEIALTPGVGIPVNGNPSQAVYFPSLNTTRPEMYQEEQQIYQYAERLLGAGSNVQGVMNTKRVTATEIAAIDRRSGIRFLTIFNRIRKGLKDIFRIALELDKEFLPPEIQVRIAGLDGTEPVFETINRQELNARVDILVNGNSILDEQADKQEMMNAYQIGIANPLIARDELSLYELTRDLYVSQNIKRVDAYLRKPVDMIPRNPDEEHNLFLQEEYIGPHTAENIEEHLRKHAELINTPEQFKLLSGKGQALLIKHFNETVAMKRAIEEMQLLIQAQQNNAALTQAQATGGVPGVTTPVAPEGAQSGPGQPG